MSVGGASEHVTPFESVGELRERHADLLAELDRELGETADKKCEALALTKLAPRVLLFLGRGVATGVYIEDIEERTACQILLDYWASTLTRVGIQTPTVGLARFDEAHLPDLKDKPCPYVGLEAFREQDERFFFGREADTERLITQLRLTPLVVVVGASGSGKSSLVLGGLLPALKSNALSGELLILPPFAPGDDPLNRLVHAVCQARVTEGIASNEGDRLRADASRLASLLGGNNAAPALIVIDQFEEIFTLCRPMDRDALAAQLQGVLVHGHRVLLTMREEFKSRMVELRALTPYLKECWYEMRPMVYEELRAAVEKPAALVNLRVAAEIADDLVKKVLGQATALPLLQFTLQALWKERDRNRITRETYRKVGEDPLTALTSFADTFYTHLAPETQDEVKRILLELVNVTDLLEAYRHPVLRSRLRQPGKANTDNVLRLLSDKELVRITPSADEADAVVEIKHESLVRNWRTLVGWIDDKRHQRRQRLALIQAATRWREMGRPEDGLLTGSLLQEAGSLPDLSDLEGEYVQRSAEAHQVRLREREVALKRELEQAKTMAHQAREVALLKSAAAGRLQLLWLLTLGLAVAIASLYFSRSAQLSAEVERGKANAKILQTMKLQPLDYVNDRLDLALLLGVEASRAAPSLPEVRRILPSALTTNLEFESLMPGHTGAVTALTYSPEGDVLASGSAGGEIILRDAKSARLLHAPIKTYAGGTWDLSFAPDGKLLASVGDDRKIRMWNIATGRPAGPPFEPDSEVGSVAISKDGTTLAAACGDGTVRVWNISTREPLTLPHNVGGANQGAVARVAFNPEGTLLASGGEDGRIVLWRVGTWKQDGVSFEVGRQVFSIAFSHDGRFIASGSQDGRTELWSVRERRWLGAGENHLRAVRGISFSRDDKTLATVSEDRSLLLHDIESLSGSDVRSRTPARSANGYHEEFWSVAFSPTGRVTTGAGNGMVVNWNFAKVHRVAQLVQSPTSQKTQAAFGLKGTVLVAFSKDKLLMWDVAKNEVDKGKSIDADQKGIKSIVVVPDGNRLVTVGDDNSIGLWDLANRTPIRPLATSGVAPIESVAVSNDSKTLAVGIIEKDRPQVRLLNLSDGTQRGDSLALPDSDEAPTAVAFSPIGTGTWWLAAAGWNLGISLWDASRGKQLEVHLPHKNVFGLAFSPNGRFLASGGKDSTIQIWRTEDWSLVRSLEYHRGPVRAVRFSPDGKLLASASQDSTVLIWDVETGQRMGPPLKGHQGPVVSLDFSPDGETLVSAAEDGGINTWHLGISSLVDQACKTAGRNLTNDEWRRFFGDDEPRVTCLNPLVDEADVMMLAGDHEGARRLFAQVARLAPTEDARTNNHLCWFGSIHRFAAIVTDACERAVNLAADDDRPFFQDSRGVNRALNGNRAGAIEDFTAILEFLNSRRGDFDASIKRRERWVGALKNGIDPFDDVTLSQLRLE
jgi:WD40 repeat protein